MKFPPGKSGGLIEAGYKVHSDLTYLPGFRRVNPAASLKRCARAAIARTRCRFRRVNPAASLKQFLGTQLHRAAGAFPPGKSGGLIEALR